MATDMRMYVSILKYMYIVRKELAAHTCTQSHHRQHKNPRVTYLDVEGNMFEIHRVANGEAVHMPRHHPWGEARPSELRVDTELTYVHVIATVIT